VAKRGKLRHPIQPLGDDGKGVLRFKMNAIVCYLLDHGGLDMNKLAELDFTVEDSQQFAQLIGYSLGGYGELSYVDNLAYDAACAVADGKDVQAARLEAAESLLAEVRKLLKPGVAVLYEKHPDDLEV
jgi:hypothetical protein